MVKIRTKAVRHGLSRLCNVLDKLTWSAKIAPRLSLQLSRCQTYVDYIILNWSTNCSVAVLDFWLLFSQ